MSSLKKIFFLVHSAINPGIENSQLMAIKEYIDETSVEDYNSWIKAMNYSNTYIYAGPFNVENTRSWLSAVNGTSTVAHKHKCIYVPVAEADENGIYLYYNKARGALYQLQPRETDLMIKPYNPFDPTTDSNYLHH